MEDLRCLFFGMQDLNSKKPSEISDLPINLQTQLAQVFGKSLYQPLKEDANDESTKLRETDSNLAWEHKKVEPLKMFFEAISGTHIGF